MSMKQRGFGMKQNQLQGSNMQQAPQQLQVLQTVVKVVNFRWSQQDDVLTLTRMKSPEDY